MNALPFHGIEASELLLTNKGAVYHLNLVPAQLADTIITVGDPARVQAVSKYFDKIECTVSHREFVTHTGYIGAKRISVISTGIGTDNIDIVLNEIDALANIDLSTRKIKPQTKQLKIIRLGTCGALHKNIQPGKLVLSAYAIGLDNLMHYYKLPNNTDEQYILHEFSLHTRLVNSIITPYIAEASIQLRKYFGKDFHHGITITSPGFFAPQGRALRAQPTFPHLVDALATFNSRDMQVLNFEMETSGLYGLGKILGHQCVSISTVTNNRITTQAIHDMDVAVDDMIRKTLAIIAGI